MVKQLSAYTLYADKANLDKYIPTHAYANEHEQQQFRILGTLLPFPPSRFPVFFSS